MKDSHRPSAIGHQLRVSGRSRWTPWRLGVFAVILLASVGCKSRSKFNEFTLPMPPSVESGVYDGVYVQADYGFGIPLPPKWSWVRLSAEQEVEEVARFTDPKGLVLVRLTVQMRDPSDGLGAREWGKTSSQDLTDHLFKIVKTLPDDSFRTGDGGKWFLAAYQVSDSHGKQWLDQEWALGREDLLIGAHVMVPWDKAGPDAGKKLLAPLADSLVQLRGYTPIGPRGVSIERFELAKFCADFSRALESRSLVRVNGYLDELYPDRSKWNAWYEQLTAGDPKSFDLKAQPGGLVINGDYASATFSIVRKDVQGSLVHKFDRSFRLSKKEGAWKITSSLDKG